MELYKDKTASIEKRVEDLLSRMTLREKFAQMFLTADTEYINDIVKTKNYPEENLGGLWGETLSPDDVNAIQEMAKNTRLGIPPIIAFESLHGLMKDGSTIFPQSIGLGATFNEELIEKMAGVIGRESYIMGIRQTFAPDLDISRDPRWGRVEENFGEDPYLTSRLGVSYVKGLQSQKVSSTLKHYIAHGTPEGGINLSPVHMGEREMREIATEPFEACCKEAGALSVMPAYSELDGVPVHTSHFLLTKLLRDELGFDGYTISDFGATGMLTNFHRVAKDSLEAGRMALDAGLDLEAPIRFAYSEEFFKQIENDSEYIKKINEAVRRILTVKFRLCLFDDPYSKPESVSEVHSKASVDLSRKIAHETMVLLKNEDSILPLSKDKKVLLVGPCAEICQTGDYSPNNAIDYTVRIKQAFQEKLGSRLTYIKGSNIANTIDTDIEKAIECAKDHDVIIAVVGDNSYFYGGIGWGNENDDSAVTCGEGFDLSSIELPEAQSELIKRLYETNKPIILVLSSGRPWSITQEIEMAKGVIAVWYPGEQGGYAVYDVIFGDECPSGKLPISFPRSTGHIPCYYNHKPSARGYYHNPGTISSPGRDYVFDTPAPLYPFGYGLSYSEFKYSNLHCEKTGENKVDVSFTVKNVGNVKAKEASLVFVSQEFCPITPFVKRLRRFKKSEYAPGEEKTISFTLNADDFSYIDQNMKKAVGKGLFRIAVENLICEVEL